MSVLRSFTFFFALAFAVMLAMPAASQSVISGDITGVVSDPSGAVIPKATVTLKSSDTGETQTTTTNDDGSYRFSLLKPGTYTVSAAATGFQASQGTATVAVGQATAVDLKMVVSASNEKVEVSAEGAVVQADNGNLSTTFSQSQVQNVPNPGNDLSYIVQTAPGAVMNTQSGYGNSPINGLPGTSNLFTLNGMNENDPFFNLNNSGATNLLLGQNDVQEVSVVSNGYSGEYGQLGGANVNYVTKSGSNSWHGNAQYFWNGSAMNANNWFNNNLGSPKPFSNANQWAASIGGPIRKDSTFFFVNTEGLRLIIPTSQPVNIPSPQFQAATLAHLTSVSPGSIPFYQQMFALYNGAPGADRATNTLPGGGCAGFSNPLLGASPCALQFQSTASNATNEWLLTARLDQNIGTKDRAFIHFRTDHGLQASFTDPINPVFNAQSDQPQYEGQLNETHTFNANSVNQLILSGSWYSAIFAPPNLQASLAAFPYNLLFAGGVFTGLGGENSVFPQGRNATQYQISDDFSWVKGRHNMKFGVNFRRNDITDYDPQIGSIGLSFATLGPSANGPNFFDGVGNQYTQNFPTRNTQPIAMYGLGFYAQDEVALRSNLKITLALRAEHNSNPVCQTNCFARFGDSFTSISHDPNEPYNQAIQTGLHQALIDTTNIIWEPRLGFAWSPLGVGTNTVVRGGIGIFADIFPGTVADNFIRNAPVNNQFTVGLGPLSPAVAGNQTALAASANSAFNAAFAAGGTLSSITAAVPTFLPPNLFNVTNSTKAPRYQEWNLQLQQGFGRRMTASIGYVGNHGIFEPVQNASQNAFCNLPGFGPSPSCTQQLGIAAPFAGLPVLPMDQRFGTITEVQSIGVSNYNGMTASLTGKFSSLQLQANYTWSHALDEVSNGGFLPFGAFPITNVSPINPQQPFNIRGNYGNADYDVRQYFSANFVWQTPKERGWLGALTSWTLAGTVFSRTGLPFTAVDGATNSVLGGFNYGTTAPGGPPLFANYPSGQPITCGSGAVTNPCPLLANFSSANTGFGVQRRNQLYGPNFFDADLSVMKNFHVPLGEKGEFGVGLQFFNLFNHPNFDQPVADVSSSQFGLITRTVSVPTSLLGSFLNGDASPRMIQVKANLSF
jgi:hypothetical protein